MSARRPKPLTAKELQLMKEQWGDDRVVRKLLWEISRLREVVHRWYTYNRQLSHYTHDLNQLAVHDDFEDLFENEPVIMERMPRTLHEYPKARRHPHMSEEQEAKLTADTESGQSIREAKRKAREAR